MITWADTICIIVKTYGVTQNDIAEHIGVTKHTLSKVKSGKQNPPAQFAAQILYKKIFDTTTSTSFTHNMNEEYCLSTIKDIISADFLSVKASMKDCWDQKDYKTFIMTLLSRTIQYNPTKKFSGVSGSDAETDHMKLLHILPEKPFLIGRENIIEQINDIFETSNYAVLTGMGGIGKSQVALAYAHSKQSENWTIQHLICENFESLQQAICKIQFADLSNEETFDSVIGRLKSCQRNTLIILDNLNKPFTHSDYIDFKKLIKCNRCIRILITSRCSLIKEKRHLVPVSALDKDDLVKLYKYHRFDDSSDHNSYISEKEKTLDQLFTIVEKHTLMVILLAKLPARTFMDECKILDNLETGLSLPLKVVDFEYDGKILEATISEIVKWLFDISNLTDREKLVMMYLSIIPSSGIDFALFQSLTDCVKKDILTLVKSNLVILDEETFKIRLHPLICEAVLSMDETKVFWHFQMPESPDDDNDDDDDEDDDLPNIERAISEPDSKTIEELSSKFENEAAGRFLWRVLTKREKSKPNKEEWHILNQIVTCYSSRIVFRIIQDIPFSKESNIKMFDILNDEYRDTILWLNKVLTRYTSIDSKKLEFMVLKKIDKKPSN